MEGKANLQSVHHDVVCRYKMYVNGIEDMLFSIYVSAILRSIVCVFVTKNIRIPAGMITTNGQADRFN